MGTGINTILGIALTILVIIIVSALLYGKDKGLLSKVADQAMSLGDRFLPNSAPTQLKQSGKLPGSVTSAQNNFVENIKRASQSESIGYCLFNFDLSGLENYQMQIKEPGVSTRIINPRYAGLLQRKEGEVYINPVIYENAELLLFDAVKYEECIRQSSLEGCKPENMCRKTGIITLSKDKINDKDGLANFMLRLPDKKSFCLIPTHSSRNPFAECDFTSTTISEKCLSEFKTSVSLC